MIMIIQDLLFCLQGNFREVELWRIILCYVRFFLSLYYNRIEIFFNMNLKNIGYKHSLSLVEILSCTYLFTDNQLRGGCVCGYVIKI